ncbi:MAG: hypothetical protein K2N86_06185, partial [Rikenellaceae bacterium]|nr:hypothetical protein [Rikenellaceae bacterium]
GDPYSVTNISIVDGPTNVVYDSDARRLDAYSYAHTYTVRVTLDRAMAGSSVKMERVADSSTGTLEATNTTSASSTTHDFTIAVPASTSESELSTQFQINVDGADVTTFTVRQAKKAAISVSQSTVIGGSDAISGTFSASSWDIKSSGFVTSSNTNLPVNNPNTNGTFSVGMASSMDQTFAKQSATIALVGADEADRATCSISQEKITFNFNPTSGNVTLAYTANSSDDVTVSSDNVTIDSSTTGLTATSNTSWLSTTVSNNKVTVKASTTNSGDERSGSFYVTYNGCRSDDFTVKQQEGVNTDPGEAMTIGGVTWSKYNLANPKQASGGATFATKLPSQLSGVRAESHGKFYQWGINVAWNTTGALDGGTPSGSWNTSTNPADWSTQPCPDGYRLPTKDEFQNLIDNCTRTDGGGWSSSDYGYITLTLKTDSSKKLEFPAVGYRNNDSSGTLYNAGTYGNYWSAVAYVSHNEYNLWFDSSDLYVDNGNSKHYGFSVRCVKGEIVPDIDPTQTVTMAGTEWMQVNL